jgi:RuvB-like protein 1
VSTVLPCSSVGLSDFTQCGFRDQDHRTTGLRIKESKEVYEGEVTEMSPAEGAANGVDQSKVIKHIVISMRTSKGTKTLKLDPSIQDGLLREKVNVGDVIYIEANSGAVKRVGRCDTHAAEYDLEADEYVPMPKARIAASDLVNICMLRDLHFSMKS